MYRCTLMNYIPCFVVFSKSIYPARHALHLRFHEIFSKHMNNFDNPVTLGSKHKLSEGIAWQRSVVARFTIKHSRLYTTTHCYTLEKICPVNRKELSIYERSDPQPKSRGCYCFIYWNLPDLRIITWLPAVLYRKGWAELSWAELSWAELTQAKSSWTESNWAKLSWDELSWANLTRVEPSWVEFLSWIELIRTKPDYQILLFVISQLYDPFIQFWIVQSS